MTLCGWKIFSKSKQRIKRTTKNEATASSAQNVQTISPNVPSGRRVNRQKDPPNLEDDVCDTEEEKPSSSGIKENNMKDIIVEEDDGNPRNKCALKPGHSLMDWIRLGSSGCDLTGTKGIIKPVSSTELEMHCKKDDAWLAIRGKVYNVTHYMDFHPGGPDELMKGVGKDATKMFDEIHAWVNYEQLLSKCYVGPLQNVVMVDLEPNHRTHQKTSSANGGSFKIPAVPSFTTTSSAKTSPVKVNTKSISNLSLSDNDSEKLEIIPRFDWIQKTSDITLIFYTKPFCNPGVIISSKSDCDFGIQILIQRTTHLCNFKLSHGVKWPGFIKLHCETGKIEINFIKIKSELWTSYGLMEMEKLDNIDDLMLEFEVAENQKITHDSFAICLKSVQKAIVVTPIGYHLSVSALVNDNYVTRSYTPIPARYLPMSCPSTCIPLLIKSYATGMLAKHIASRSVNTSSSISNDNVLKLSQPKGNFVLKKLLDHCRIGLLAAGSGITPMLSVLDHLLARNTNRIESIQLLLFNKSEEDIWCRHKLESTAIKDKRLVVRHILSEPDINWNGETGRVSKELISPFNDSESITYCCICGPTPFNELCQEIFKDIGFQSTNLHFFQG